MHRFNNAVIGVNPRYRLKNDNFSMSIGAKVEFTLNSGKFFHIAPDINVSWTPVSRFTIWGKAVVASIATPSARSMMSTT